jgi:outer membrane protein TolC
MNAASPRLLPALVPFVIAAGLAGPAAARCIDEETVEMPRGGAAMPAGDAQAPRMALQGMVREAIRRSNAIGAAKLLADAAQDDVRETKAQRWPLATGVASLGSTSTEVAGVDEGRGKQGRVSIGISAPLFDFGRISSLTDWRSSLAEAARLGELNAQEQVALQTVSLAIERSRYRLQAQVYQQYSRKMSCLVEALETIVRADRGRTSELVQAQKTQQQAEIAYAQTNSMIRQIETRLQRFVGDKLPNTDGMTSVLLNMPSLQDAIAEAERAPDMAQLDKQAEAAEYLAKSVVASQRPQVGWSVNGTKVKGVGNSAQWSAGLNVNVPLFNAGADPQADASRKRAEAARLQRADALEGRRFRMAEVHEQGLSSFDRAKRVVEVLRDSDRVRNFTLQQWQQLGRRSLFDVMGAESEHYSLRVAYVNALYDGQQANALLRSLGLGVNAWLQ